MAKLTPGFKLYIYQLLSRELGIGKQTLLPQVEEALAADDIIPADLECESVQELVEGCPDFLKLRVFKKGRAYVTVLRNEEWDEMLAAPPEKPDAKKAPTGGPRTWKKKKGGKKSLKPVKPGKQRRDREAAEAQRAAEEAALREKLAAEEAASEPAEEVPAAEVIAPEAQTGPEAQPAEAAEEHREAPAEDEGTISPEQGHTPEPQAPVARTVAEILEEARRAEREAQEAAEEQKAAGPEAESASEADAVPEPNVQEQKGTTEPVAPEVKPIPAAPAPSPISLTITYNPYEDMERDIAERQKVQAPEVASRPTPAQPESAPKPQKPAIPLAGLPEDFGQEVSCGDALLRSLYQLLPYDMEPMAVLDVDWRVARATGTLSGTRSRVTFPLRYLHEDGSPIEVTLRRSSRNAFGKRWSLALVDGDDGTGGSHDSVGFEGVPSSDEGAWSDLSGGSADPLASPVRELAQQVVIGTWDSFLGSLATMAAPEPWNYPGEGVGKASRYGILREYISTTFHRARMQDRIVSSEDGSFAAFCTGLLTPFGQDIYACLTARPGDIPWKFAGFAVAGSGELGARLTGTLPHLPEAPSYLSSLQDVTPGQGRMVILDTDAILGNQLGRLPHAFLAEHLEGNFAAEALLSAGSALTQAELRDLARIIRSDASAYRRLRRTLDDAVDQALLRVRVSYRDAAPTFDPADGRTKLMVPLCLVEDGHADCALVLDLQPSGAYRAASIVPLHRAYACARVISREQPSWLAAKRVL